jgi:HAD superfamily hydrolase (TIGR01509 family)
METVIREINDERQIVTSAMVVRKAFRTVAVEFGLTRDNCATHPSFTTAEQLKALQGRGLQFLGLFADGEQAGFVAMERAGESEFYMEKLAVLPRFRHMGYGTWLVSSVLERAAKQGASRLSIGIINEHTVLKRWYEGLGFVETSTKSFAHLPFTVCFMEIAVPNRLGPTTPKVVVLDAMGVMYSANDDVKELLFPFVVEKGGSRDANRVTELYRSVSLGEMSASDFWNGAGVAPELEDEYLSRHEVRNGLVTFLDEIRKAGVRVWCLSNDVSEWSRKLRTRFGLEDYFEGFVISGDAGARKPHPAIFQNLMSRLGCSPADVVFIDDNVTNLDRATALGFRTILFGGVPGPDCRHATAGSFEQVHSLLFADHSKEAIHD